jgi:hypothetical protein
MLNEQVGLISIPSVYSEHLLCSFLITRFPTDLLSFPFLVRPTVVQCH